MKVWLAIEVVSLAAVRTEECGWICGHEVASFGAAAPGRVRWRDVSGNLKREHGLLYSSTCTSGQSHFCLCSLRCVLSLIFVHILF